MTHKPFTVGDLVVTLEKIAVAMKSKRNMKNFLNKLNNEDGFNKFKDYKRFRNVVGICYLTSIFAGKDVQELLLGTFYMLYDSPIDPFGKFYKGSYCEPVLNYSLRVREIENTILPYLKGLDQNATTI